MSWRHESLKVRRVRIRATAKAGYLVGGKPARPGEESVCDFADAETLRLTGKAVIIGEEAARTLPGRDLAPPRSTPSWSDLPR